MGKARSFEQRTGLPDLRLSPTCFVWNPDTAPVTGILLSLFSQMRKSADQGEWRGLESALTAGERNSQKTVSAYVSEPLLFFLLGQAAPRLREG